MDCVFKPFSLWSGWLYCSWGTVSVQYQTDLMRLILLTLDLLYLGSSIQEQNPKCSMRAQGWSPMATFSCSVVSVVSQLRRFCIVLGFQVSRSFASVVRGACVDIQLKIAPHCWHNAVQSNVVNHAMGDLASGQFHEYECSFMVSMHL